MRLKRRATMPLPLCYDNGVKFLALLLLAAAAFAQSAAPVSPRSAPRRSAPARQTAAAPAVSPDDGSLSERTYTSDYFGFRYTLPDGMDVDDDFMEGRQDQSGRSFVLLAATEHEEATNRTVVIVADNAGAAGATEPGAYLDKVAGEALKRQGFQPSGPASVVTIAGRSFARADFTKEKVAETLLVTILRGYAVNFVLTAPSTEEVEELAKSLQTVEFPQPKASAETTAPAKR
jgi:hypothetical protein